MDISFIIVNFKSRNHLANCIDSIVSELKEFNYEIIIVNNDKQPLSGIKTPKQTIIIENSVNEGFARACNLGVLSANGKILFFLNPDTIIYSQGIKDFFFRLEDEKTGIVAPRLIETSGEVQPWSAGPEFTITSIIKNKLSCKENNFPWSSQTETDVAWVSGAAFIIKNSLFKRVGGFDENFFMYFEDVDICKRIRMCGKKIILFPSFKVLHVGGQSFKSTLEKKKFYYEAQDYYFSKYFSNATVLLLKILRKIFLTNYNKSN